MKSFQNHTRTERSFIRLFVAQNVAAGHTSGKAVSYRQAKLAVDHKQEGALGYGLAWGIAGSHNVEIAHSFSWKTVGGTTKVKVESVYAWNDEIDWNAANEGNPNNQMKGVEAFLDHLCDKLLRLNYWVTIMYRRTELLELAKGR